MKTEKGNQIEKTYYYYLAMTTAAQTNQRLFSFPDGQVGADGSITNYDGSGGKLPERHVMRIAKIGFMARNSDGTPLTSAEVSKLSIGTYSVFMGNREVKRGTLNEFFKVPVQIGTTVDAAGTGDVPTHANVENADRVFIPLLQEETWLDEALDFRISVPAFASGTTVQVAGCVKGVIIQP